MKQNTQSVLWSYRTRLLPLGVTVTIIGAVILGFAPKHILRAIHQPLTAKEQAGLTPHQAMIKLQDGNDRFVSGKTCTRSCSAQRAATAAGQYPFAFVLSCIDSRTSSELVFDQGLGDIFNARIAGNVLSPDVLGSMEFACQVAGAKLIVVLGHTKCGAMAGACAGVKLGHLTGLLSKVDPCVSEARVHHPGAAKNDPCLIAEVTERNVRQVVTQVQKQSPILRDLIASGKVGLVGGIQDLESGKVRFLQ